MKNFIEVFNEINVEQIPSGHGKSFKKGICKELIDNGDFSVPNGHERSYRRGKEVGNILQELISKNIKMM